MIRRKSSLTGTYSSEIIVDFISFAIKMFVLNILMFIVKFSFIVKVLLSLNMYISCYMQLKVYVKVVRKRYIPVYILYIVLRSFVIQVFKNNINLISDLRGLIL